MKKEINLGVCPICGEMGHEVQCIPTQMYDAPYEVYFDCPFCGSFDPMDEELMEVFKDENNRD